MLFMHLCLQKPYEQHAGLWLALRKLLSDCPGTATQCKTKHPSPAAPVLLLLLSD
jgi:hypothetical protein